MLVAIVGTLVKTEVVSYGWSSLASCGVVDRLPAGMWVPMTAMPTNRFPTCSARCRPLVGVSEYFTDLSWAKGSASENGGLALRSCSERYGDRVFRRVRQAAEFLPADDHVSQPKRHQPWPRHMAGVVRIASSPEASWAFT